MAITSNSHLLSNLTSLIDPNQRSQKQTLQDQLTQRRQAAEKVKKIQRDVEKQGLIDANRRALKTLQDKLKADELEKLKEKFSSSGQKNPKTANLNHRENLGQSLNNPVPSKPGQIINILV